MKNEDEKTVFSIRINRKRHRFISDLILAIKMLLALAAIFVTVATIQFAICQRTFPNKSVMNCLAPRYNK